MKAKYMNYQMNLFKNLVIVCCILFWMCTVSVKAQFEVVIPTTAKPPSSSRPRPTQPRREVVQRVINTVRTVKTVEIRKTSNLSVYTEPGATVQLEPINNVRPQKGNKQISNKEKKIEQQTANDKGVVVFENLSPIEYKIRADKIGFKTLVQDVVKILPQKTLAIDMNLFQITQDVSINTNVNGGEVRYAPADLQEIRADGSLVIKENGAYCFEPIKNKKAIIKGLKNGYYSIDIRPSFDEIQFSSEKTAVKVESTVDSSELEDASLNFEILLKKKISEGVFASGWTSDEWEKPSGWKLGNTMKTDGSFGVALPKNEQYRYYTDFTMRSDVRLINDDTIGFIARAEDDRSFYLFQIFGAKAETPYVIKGYIVKKGKEEPPFFTQTLAPFRKIIDGGNFAVIIKAKDNAFSFFIEDKKGNPLPVGDVTDPNNSFRKGAVGLAARKNSNFEVASFVVCGSSCK